MSQELMNPAASMSAVEIDVHCALVIARAAIKGVSSVSPVAKAVILAALDDAVEALNLDVSPQAPAVAAMIRQVRRELA